MGALGVWASVRLPRASTAAGEVAGAVAGADRGEFTWDVHVNVDDIATVAPCADDSLPSSGYAFFVGLKSGRGLFFVASSKVRRARFKSEAIQSTRRRDERSF